MPLVDRFGNNVVDRAGNIILMRGETPPPVDWTPNDLPNLKQWALDPDAGNPAYKDGLLDGKAVLNPLEAHGTFRAPRGGRCYLFDGVDDYILCPDVLGGLTAFTVVIDVDLVDNATGGYVGYWGAGNDRTLLFRTSTNGRPQVYHWDTGNTQVGGELSDLAVSSGVRAQVAALCDGATLTGAVDGVLSATTFSVSNPLGNLAPGTGIGGGSPSFSPLNGRVFSVRVYNRQLTVDELNYLRTGTGTDPGLSNLTALYRCNEQTNIKAFDSSGNGNHGIITNATLRNFHATDADVDSNPANTVGHTCGIYLRSVATASFSGNWESAEFFDGDGSFSCSYLNNPDSNSYFLGVGDAQHTGDNAYLHQKYALRGQGSNQAYVYRDGVLQNPIITLPTQRNGGDVYTWKRVGTTVDLLFNGVSVWQITDDSSGRWRGSYCGNSSAQYIAWGQTTFHEWEIAYDSVDWEDGIAPRDESTPANSVIGEPLQYSGETPYPMVVSSPVGTFDGVDDYVEVPPTSDHDMAGVPFSISAWVKWTNDQNNTIILERAAWNAGTYIIETRFASQGGVNFGINDTGAVSIQSIGALNDGNWHHVVCVADQVDQIIYIDGVLNNSAASGGVITSVNQRIQIGSRNGNGDFDGQIAGVRLYKNQALTADEVKFLYDGTGVDPGSANVVGDYTFSEGDGTTIYDASGNGNHGTVTNATLANFWAGTSDTSRDHCIEYGGRYTGNYAFKTSDPWDVSECTVEANSTTDPLGGNEGHKLVTQVAQGSQTMFKGYNFDFQSPPGYVTWYVKNAGYNYAACGDDGNRLHFVNLTTGQVDGVVGSPPPITVVDAGNGWWRVGLEATANRTYHCICSDQVYGARPNWAGDGVNGIYVAMMQAGTGFHPYEENPGIYPSYIPFRFIPGVTLDRDYWIWSDVVQNALPASTLTCRIKSPDTSGVVFEATETALSYCLFWDQGGGGSCLEKATTLIFDSVDRSSWTADELYQALSDNQWHDVELQGIDTTGWGRFGIGNYENTPSFNSTNMQVDSLVIDGVSYPRIAAADGNPITLEAKHFGNPFSSLDYDAWDAPELNDLLLPASTTTGEDLANDDHIGTKFRSRTGTDVEGVGVFDGVAARVWSGVTGDMIQTGAPLSESWGVSFWMKQESAKNNARCYDMNVGTPRFYTACGNTDLFWGFASQFNNSVSFPIDFDQWMHVVTTYDHTVNRVRMYKNGVLQNDSAYTGDGNLGAIGDTPIVFGARDDTDATQGDFFNGELREFKIFTQKAIGDAEAAFLYDPTTGSDPGAMAGEYLFGDGSGTTVSDTSGNNRDGLLVGNDGPTFWSNYFPPLPTPEGDDKFVNSYPAPAGQDLSDLLDYLAEVEPLLPPVNTVAPAVTGTPEPGEVLTCSTGTWDPAGDSYAFQWYESTDGLGTGRTPIAGATNATYTVQASEIGKFLSCTVTATNTAGSDTADSNYVEVVSAPVNTVAPAVTGTPEPGEILTCSQGTWDPAGDSYTYQWYDSDDAIGTNRTPIVGATASTYTVLAGDVGMYLSCTVTATNATGSTPADSNYVEVVAGVLPPSNTTPPRVTGTPNPGFNLYSSRGVWDNAPDSYAYQWYTADDGIGTGLAPIAGQTTSSYLLVAGDVGKFVMCRVTATNTAGSDSADSNYVEIFAKSAMLENFQFLTTPF